MLAEQPRALKMAHDLLLGGGLVVFPTDTVYGVGALAHNPSGIQQLYKVKGRQSTKAIPILLGDPADLPRVTSTIDARVQRLAERFWPGALTLVVPRHPSLPEVLSPYPTVGVRVPDHPHALALLRLCGPLAVTSANLSDRPSTTTVQEVLDQLDGSLPLVLDGGSTPGGVSSTVVDCTQEQLVVLRQGPISLEMLLEAL